MKPKKRFLYKEMHSDVRHAGEISHQTAREWMMVKGHRTIYTQGNLAPARLWTHTLQLLWTHIPVPSPLPPYLPGHILSLLPQVPDKILSSNPKGCQTERRISLRTIWEGEADGSITMWKPVTRNGLVQSCLQLQTGPQGHSPRF